MDIKAVLKNLNILYVEDDEIIRSSLSRTLQHICKNIYEAENGKEGLKLYKELKPDILLTDIDMPDMDGIEFVKIVREDNMKMPIVMITAYSNEHYLLEAVKLHLEDYILKPIVYQRLLEAVEKCARRVVENGDFEIEFSNGSIYDIKNSVIHRDDEVIPLTKKEVLFLKLLILNKDSVVSHEEIERSVWSEAEMSKGALKTLVNKLRQKVGNEVITSHFGIGYKVVL